MLLLLCAHKHWVGTIVLVVLLFESTLTGDYGARALNAL